MRLGQALKFAGYKPRIIPGTGLVSVRWQVGLGGFIRGLEKNFFAALDFDPAKVLVVTLGLFTLAVAPYLGLFVGPTWARACCGLGVASVAAILAMTRKHSRIGWPYAFVLPLAAAVDVRLARPLDRADPGPGRGDLAGASLPDPRAAGPRPPPRRLAPRGLAVDPVSRGRASACPDREG